MIRTTTLLGLFASATLLFACGDDDGDNNNNSNADPCAGAAPLAWEQEGVCAGAVQVCDPATGWVEPDYSQIQGYEATETVCDDLDNDCDGHVDEGLTTTGFNDADGDGYGDPNDHDEFCTLPSDFITDNTDCDDASDLVNTDGVEVCDGLDNDCDGKVDAGTCHANAHCDDSGVAIACTCDAGYTGDGSSCDAVWTAVSAGENHGCALKGEGQLFCWGGNAFGQLGDGSALDTFDATPVGVQSDWILVSAGASSTCGIRGGQLYCWGRAVTSGGTFPNDGLLGLGINWANRLSCSAAEARCVSPERVGFDSGWTHISVGGDHICGIEAGVLSCWGSNHRGQLGLGDTTDRVTPQPVGSDTDWTLVSVSYQGHTCGIRAGGLYCWGSNRGGPNSGNVVTGQLGLGNVGDQHTPQRVGTGSDWTWVSAYARSTCGIRSGQLWCWGRNGHGQLGLGDTTDQLTPQRVGSGADWSATDHDLEAAACGIRGGALYCWGMNSNDSLGLGPNWLNLTGCTDPGEPQCVSPLPVGSRTHWTAIDGGYSWHCGVESGALYCWGDNAFGQLGQDPDAVTGLDAPTLAFP